MAQVDLVLQAGTEQVFGRTLISGGTTVAHVRKVQENCRWPSENWQDQHASSCFQCLLYKAMRGSSGTTPYDGDTLAEQLEQARTLMQDVAAGPQVAIVDLGYRGREVEGVQILHRGKAKSLTRRQWRWIKRRQAVEPVIGHLKQEHRLDRCWLKGAQGDALNAIGAAAGYNLRWLMRWIAFLRAWFRAIMLLPMAERSAVVAAVIC